MMTAADAGLIAVRFLVVWLVTQAVNKHVIPGLPDDKTIDAFANLLLSGIVTLAMILWALKARLAAMFQARLHSIKALADAPEVVTVHVEPATAAALQAQGATNVVPTPPAAP